MTVMVAEPVAETAQEYAQIVTDGGAACERVATAAQALDLLQQKEFALLVASRWLPDLSGEALAALLRGMTGHRPEVLVVSSPSVDRIALEHWLRSQSKTGDGAATAAV